MLPLESERWNELTTFYGEPADVPRVLRQWLDAVGSDEEQTIYCRDFFDLFLHQGTITNAAFAVVPWLVQVCSDGKSAFRIEYLTDVALVEANRIRYGVCCNREGTAECPEWLMGDYHQAIEQAQKLVDDVLASESDEDRKGNLAGMKPALFGDAETAWKNWGVDE